jgi:hypothetical protein
VIEAEALLGVTGLLPPYHVQTADQWPGNNEVNASRVLVESLKTQLTAVLEQDEPKKLTASGLGPTFHKRLAAPPNYPDMVADLGPLVGLQLATAYTDAHQTARAAVMASYPGKDIDLGFTVGTAEPSDLELSRYLFGADIIENHRIVTDLQSAALSRRVLALYLACFPETYAILIAHLFEIVTRKRATGWRPAWWLEHQLRIFLQAPLRGPLEATEPPPPANNTRGSVNTKALAVPGTEVPK